MPNAFDTVTRRHPTVIRLRLTVAHLCVLALATAVVTTATILATGHIMLGVIGVLAALVVYPTGYALTAHRYRTRLRHEVARARTDPLTGLPNRAVADETLDEATRTGAPMTVALIDVDGLHMVNTSLGHAAGDQYLTTVARRLAGAVPPGGVLVRQGGDELTLLAPGADPRQLATTIGAALAGPAVIAGYRIQPRASVGIAATDDTDMGDANHTRARADSAMYTAKRDGGNQIRVFDAERDPEPSPDGTRPLLRRRDTNPLAAAGVAWLPTPGDQLIPLLLSPDELRTVAQALGTARDRWTHAAT